VKSSVASNDCDVPPLSVVSLLKVPDANVPPPAYDVVADPFETTQPSSSRAKLGRHPIAPDSHMSEIRC
jgi:hypothetical protein